MNTFLGLLLLVFAMALLVSYIASRPRGRQLIALGNVAEGFQPAHVTRTAEAVMPQRNLLVKPGAAAGGIALAGTADIPLGFTRDIADAIGDKITVSVLGVQDGCLLGVASAAIARDALLVPAAGGKLRALPVAAGSYYIVGRAINAPGADGDDVEVIPCFPTLRVVT